MSVHLSIHVCVMPMSVCNNFAAGVRPVYPVSFLSGFLLAGFFFQKKYENYSNEIETRFVDLVTGRVCCL